MAKRSVEFEQTEIGEVIVCHPDRFEVIYKSGAPELDGKLIKGLGFTSVEADKILMGDVGFKTEEGFEDKIKTITSAILDYCNLD